MQPNCSYKQLIHRADRIGNNTIAGQLLSGTHRVRNHAALKQKTLTLPGGYLLWNSAWPAADRSEMVDEEITSFLREWAVLKK